MKKKRYYTFLICFFAFIALKAQYSAPEDGKVYRIVSPQYSDIAITEDFGNNKLSCNPKSSGTNYTQLWKVIKSGAGWRIQNIYTGRYISPQETLYSQYSTLTTTSTLYIASNSASTQLYNIVNSNGGSRGLHCDGGHNVVPWSIGSGSISASEWRFEAVAITDEEIAAARVSYQDYLYIVNNKDSIATKYIGFFSDDACTELKPAYASMSDDDLKNAMQGCSAQLIDIAIKIKNNSWTAYEKEFRIANYGPHSDLGYWAGKLKTNHHCPLSNPTGIYGNSGDVIYVFVANDIPQNATLEIDRVNGNAAFGTRGTLKKGMNIVTVGRDQAMLFIAYHVDTSGDKLTTDFDSLKIHIQGGVLNGYWDRSRHDDTDWVNIAKGLATHEMIQVKGERVLFHMNREYITAANCCPNTITDAIELWDNIIKWEHKVMGLDNYFPAKFNNHAGARTTATGFMSAGQYFTNYQYGTLSSILPKRNVNDIWGPAHEFGHVYQSAINMIGCAEVSNNLFSNVVVHNFGRHMSRGFTIADKVARYEKKEPFLKQSIWQTTRMYWQLYLYYHLAGNNPEFYPRLFELLRQDPLQKQAGTVNYASRDQLKFAEKCCEAAGEDLTGFFEAAGFFVPMNRVTIADYSSYDVTSTQAMINSTKKKMAAYPKKAGAIEFIEDRVAHSPRLDGVSGNRQTYDVSIGQAGDLGQYTAFTVDSMKTTASNYLYNKIGKNIYFSNGKGAVGFRIYDTEGMLLTYCNTLQHQLADDFFANELVIKAVSANGEESDVRPIYEGDEATQLNALKKAIEEAGKLLKLVDPTATKVGYYYDYALAHLSELNESASKAITAEDQTTHTYGEWAKLLSDELNKLFTDSSIKIWVNEKNYYTFRNIQYATHRMAFASTTKLLGCTSNPNTNDFMRFTFVPTGTAGEYYLKHLSGAYVSSIAQSTQAEAKATTQAGAIKFTIIDNLNGEICVQKIDDGMGYLHCDRNYAVVGWNTGSKGSFWSIVCVNDNKAEEELHALDSLLILANKVLADVIDEAKSAVNITLHDYVEVTDTQILTYITSLKEQMVITDSIKQAKYISLYADEYQNLSKKIATLQGAYNLATSIKQIGIDGDKPQQIYTINGQRVDRIGNERIYIVNGQKVLNK